MEWKKDVLSSMGLPIVNLTAQDWVLLSLLANGQNPIKGEESLHAIFFMMHYPPFSFKPLILYIYSSELHQALEELIRIGLVRRSYAHEKSRPVEVYSLTEKGAVEALRLAEKVEENWVAIGDVMIREGSKVLSELEAMKKTYNGRDPIEILKLFLEKIDNPESTFDLWFSGDEIEFMKKVLRSFKVSYAAHPSFLK